MDARAGGSDWLAKLRTCHQASFGTLCGLVLAVHLTTALGLACLFRVHQESLANWCFTLLVGGQLCLVGLTAIIHCPLLFSQAARQPSRSLRFWFFAVQAIAWCERSHR